MLCLVADGENLNDAERRLVFEIMMNPDRYLTHTISEHNRLCTENNQCVLCLLDSVLLR